MIFPKRQFKRLHNELGAQPGFKRALWKKLDAAWDTKHMPAHAWYHTLQFRMSAAVLVGLLAVATVSTGAYAYTSPSVTAGSVLYPIKQRIEAVQEKLQTTPEAKATFTLKQLERREEEKRTLEKKPATRTKVIQAEAAIKQVVQELETTEVKLKTVSSTKSKELQEKIQKRLDERKEKNDRKEKIEKSERRETEREKREQERDEKRTERTKDRKNRD